MPSWPLWLCQWCSVWWCLVLMIMHLWCLCAYDFMISWLVNVRFWWCWLWWHFTKMVASFKYKMRALRALASLLSTSSSKGACKCSCFSGSYLFMFSGGHRGWQVPGARGVQGEPVRDVHGRDSGTYRGRISTDSHPPLSGQMTMILGNHQWESVQKEALGIVLCPKT